MTIVIDSNDLTIKKKKLPTEAFFVDTNIIILYKDPFSISLNKPELNSISEKISKSISYLKSHHKSYSTIYSAFEYYKHIQHNFYTSQTGEKFLDTINFKRLKIENLDFKTGWEYHMKAFKKVFYKNFLIFDSKENKSDLIYNFDFESMDFGDYAIWKSVESCIPSYHCLFSNDLDLYNITDDIYLLTTNSKIIERAKAEGKLFL